VQRLDIDVERLMAEPAALRKFSRSFASRPQGLDHSAEEEACLH
jgi:hypothetical protein